MTWGACSGSGARGENDHIGSLPVPLYLVQVPVSRETEEVYEEQGWLGFGEWEDRAQPQNLPEMLSSEWQKKETR